MFDKEQLQFGYRTSYIQGKPLIVTEVNLSLKLVRSGRVKGHYE